MERKIFFYYSPDLPPSFRKAIGSLVVENQLEPDYDRAVINSQQTDAINMLLQSPNYTLECDDPNLEISRFIGASAKQWEIIKSNLVNASIIYFDGNKTRISLRTVIRKASEPYITLDALQSIKRNARKKPGLLTEIEYDQLLGAIANKQKSEFKEVGSYKFLTFKFSHLGENFEDKRYAPKKFVSLNPFYKLLLAIHTSSSYATTDEAYQERVERLMNKYISNPDLHLNTNQISSYQQILLGAHLIEPKPNFPAQHTLTQKALQVVQFYDRKPDNKTKADIEAAEASINELNQHLTYDNP